MVEKQTENFVIDSNIELDYFDEVVSYIILHEKEILDFFNLDRFPKKCHISLLDYDAFKQMEEKMFGKIINYIRGITSGNGDIIILNVDDQIKYTTHKDATLDNTLKMILHEVVHSANAIANNDFDETTWFREGLATNLSKQNYSLVDLSTCDFNLLKKDFNSYGKNNYNFAYTIVYYILNNCDKSEIKKLVLDSNYLRDNANRLFEEAKGVYSNKKITR